ncbi:MAG: glutaredoxin domain-containing protein [Planctomycetota bacterium]
MPEQTAEVVVYRTQGCPFCIAAAKFLDDRDVTYREVHLDDHANRRAVTSEILPGHDTVPLVVIGGKPVGGFMELRALDARGGLDPLLAGNAS